MVFPMPKSALTLPIGFILLCFAFQTFSQHGTTKQEPSSSLRLVQQSRPGSMDLSTTIDVARILNKRKRKRKKESSQTAKQKRRKRRKSRRKRKKGKRKRRRKKKKALNSVADIDPDLRIANQSLQAPLPLLTADFSKASPRNPLSLIGASDMSAEKVEVALTVDRPTNAYLVAIGSDSMSRRLMLDPLETSCPPTQPVLDSWRQPRGEFTILVPGLEDSGVVLCSMEGDVFGVYYHDVVFDIDEELGTAKPNPTNRPTERPTRRPTLRPTRRPTSRPTTRPTPAPTLWQAPPPTGAAESRLVNRPTSSPTFRQTSPPTKLQQLSAGYYDDFSWDDLEMDIQLAAGILGYDKKSWNRGITSEADEKFWSQLSAAEQDAAMVLLYDESTWNEDISLNFDCSTLEDWYWDDIPVELLPYLKGLDYTEMSWDSEDPDLQPDTAFATWDQLSPRNQGFASKLGYDSDSWENGC